MKQQIQYLEDAFGHYAKAAAAEDGSSKNPAAAGGSGGGSGRIGWMGRVTGSRSANEERFVRT